MCINKPRNPTDLKRPPPPLYRIMRICGRWVHLVLRSLPKVCNGNTPLGVSAISQFPLNLCGVTTLKTEQSHMARPSTLASVQNIMNSRRLVTEDMATNGRLVVFTVRGKGTVLPVKTKAGDDVPAADGSGEQLMKRIFNVVANSQLAINNKRNQDLLRAGYAAEQAGDTAKAEELYNEYLNAIQVSFNVLSTSSAFNKITDGDQIKASVAKVTTENGSLLTLDAKSIAVVAPEMAGATKVDLLALMAVPSAPETAAPSVNATEIVAGA